MIYSPTSRAAVFYRGLFGVLLVTTYNFGSSSEPSVSVILSVSGVSFVRSAFLELISDGGSSALP